MSLWLVSGRVLLSLPGTWTLSLRQTGGESHHDHQRYRLIQVSNMNLKQGIKRHLYLSSGVSCQ